MVQVKPRVFSVFVAISLLLMFLDSKKLVEPEKRAVQVVTVPMQYFYYRAGQNFANTFSFLTFWRSGEARIKNLEQRNLELMVNERKASELALENAQLRRQLGASLKTEKKLVPAMVFGKNRYLEIDNLGVEGGNVVYLNNLVGRIEKNSGRTSFVQLPTDTGSKIPVKVGKATGLVIGQYNSSILLDKVAQNEEIKVDDLVVTSGEGGSYEPNLIVGKISKIESVPTDLFQKATIVSLIDYGELQTVFVMEDK
jgi:rod shape-determining protein MreC